METDLDLNGKSLLNFNSPISFKSKSVILGKYNYSNSRGFIEINGIYHYHAFGVDLTVKKVTLRVTKSDIGTFNSSDTAVKIVTRRGSSTATGVMVGELRAISFSFDFAVSGDEEFWIELTRRSIIKKAEVVIIIEIYFFFSKNETETQPKAKNILFQPY